MTADLEALVVAAYVFADEYPVPARPGRPARVSDAELVALAVCQAAMGISSDRQFLGLVGYRLPGWFPYLPSQSQYNRRLRSLVGLISAVQLRLAHWLDSGEARLADGTLLACANYPGCASRSAFAGFARYGYAKSQHRFVWGVRLVLVSDPRGVPLGYTLVPANEKEYEPLADLLHGYSQSERRDRRQGVVGTRHIASGWQQQESSLTPAKKRPPPTRPASADSPPRTRLAIESVFFNLKGQMRLEQHLAKTPAGLAARIAQRLLALTLGILLNTLAGRPARALAAYDGR